MNRLRNKLIVVFLVATLAPLGVTLWVTTSLFEQSLRANGESQADLDEISQSLEKTGKELYQRAREALKSDAEAGRIVPKKYDASDPTVREFWESGEAERFALSGDGGDRLEYLARRDNDVWSYSTDLEVGMRLLSDQIASAH